ncbi:type IX secretion system membrane protein PorP/SprF [Daejeonella sp.]|uniref:type IX secretion system membrane protein PorP/SprF n=1 Tax=Daejeonella sp. TaxID=2805397 RepID=UPI003C724D8D
MGYRQITGLSHYIDAGLNFSYKSVLDLSVLYHSNKSITGGFSFDYDQKVRLSCFYNSETPQLRSLSGGTFELSIGMPFSIMKQ